MSDIQTVLSDFLSGKKIKTNHPDFACDYYQYSGKFSVVGYKGPSKKETLTLAEFRQKSEEVNADWSSFEGRLVKRASKK